MIARYAIATALAALAGCDPALPPPPRSMPIGQRPGLTLLDESGASFELSSLRGRPALIVFVRGAT